jgi:hypothetical protein
MTLLDSLRLLAWIPFPRSVRGVDAYDAAEEPHEKVKDKKKSTVRPTENAGQHRANRED